jgi:hypothetical protein
VPIVEHRPSYSVAESRANELGGWYHPGHVRIGPGFPFTPAGISLFSVGLFTMARVAHDVSFEVDPKVSFEVDPKKTRNEATDTINEGVAREQADPRHLQG